MKTGWIYTIISKINGKMYIGQSIHVRKRVRCHFCQLDKGNHSNPYLQRAFDKYNGRNNFKIEIIEENIVKDNLSNREKFWIKKYDTYRGRGYNLTPGGGVLRGGDHPRYGKHHSEETRRKMSKVKKGKNNPNYGGLTEAHKKKISEALKDKHIGINNPMYGKTKEDNPFYGENHTEKVKEKMSKLRKDMFSGKDNPNCKTSIKMIKRIIKIYYDSKLTQSQIADDFNLHQTDISKICNGNHWTYRESKEVRELLDDLKDE